MTKTVLRILINALALWVASLILPGIAMTSPGTTGAEAPETVLKMVLAYIFIGLIFGVVNALVKPIVKFLSIPVTLLTLGLFTIVINAAMLWLTAWLTSYTPVRFTIDTFFWTAILASLIISVVSMMAGGLVKSRDHR